VLGLADASHDVRGCLVEGDIEAAGVVEEGGSGVAGLSNDLGSGALRILSIQEGGVEGALEDFRLAQALLHAPKPTSDR